MHLRAGELDRRITLKNKQFGQRDSDGSYLPASISDVTVSAKYQQNPSREAVAGSQLIDQVECEFWIRYRTDVNNATVIVFKEQEYEVLSVLEINRREGLKLLAKRLRP